MQDEHASALPPGQDPWQIPGAFSGQDPLLPETPPAGQWAAIEARMRKKRRRGLLWWWLTGALLLGVGVGAGSYWGMRTEGEAAQGVVPLVREQGSASDKKALETAFPEANTIPSEKQGVSAKTNEIQKLAGSSESTSLPSEKHEEEGSTVTAESKVHNSRSEQGSKLSLQGIAPKKKPRSKGGRSRVSEGGVIIAEAAKDVVEKPLPWVAAQEPHNPAQSDQTATTSSLEEISTPTREAPDKPPFETALVKTDTVPDSLPRKIAVADSVTPKVVVVVPVATAEKKPGLLWFVGIGGVTSADRVLVPKASSAGGARLTDVQLSRGWQAHLGLGIPAMSSEKLKTEVSVWGAGISQVYTVVPARQGEPTYTYQNSGDSLIAIPNTPAPVEKRSQLWQFGVQPAIRYRLGNKGWALHAGLGLWSFWQTGEETSPMKLQLQPQAGISVPLVWKLELLGTARYQSPLSSRFGDLSGRQERFYFGLGLVWRR